MTFVCVCVRDGGRVVPGENEKRQQQQRGATRSQKCGLQSVAERRGRARSERNGRKRRRSRSGLIAPQILTWLILPPPPPVYLSKVTSYTNEGFKTSPRRLANSSRRPLKISSPMMLFARRKEGKISRTALFRFRATGIGRAFGFRFFGLIADSRKSYLLG